MSLGHERCLRCQKKFGEDLFLSSYFCPSPDLLFMNQQEHSATEKLVVVVGFCCFLPSFHLKVYASHSCPLVVHSHTHHYLMFVLHAISDTCSCLMQEGGICFCKHQICHIQITATHRSGIWCRKLRDRKGGIYNIGGKERVPVDALSLHNIGP